MKRLPIGIENFKELINKNYYYVDKTEFIKDVCNEKVALYTRPRRFGKTLNMSMLSEFFDCTKDAKTLFKDTAIMNTEYASARNQYPTIFLSFADCKGRNDDIKISIFYLLRTKMAEYLNLLDNENVDGDLKERYQMIYRALAGETDFTRIQFSIVLMCELLYKVYGKPVILLIDEYDTPFIEAHVNECYDQVHGSLAGMLSRALKDNPFLQYAMLTGIQRVAKENIFSGLNNLKVHTVASSNYASYFGFVEEEVKAMLEYYGLPYSDAVKAM